MENTYIVEVRQENAMHAGTKAKQDITRILSENGMHKLGIEIPRHKLTRAIRGNALWKKELEKVAVGDYIFYQYPAYSRVLSNSFMKYAKKKKLIKVLIIHDIDSLRFYIDRPADCRREINFFNQFEFIIGHNQNMENWLTSHGVNKKIIQLGLFDYLPSIKNNEFFETSNENIVFAGNLAKSKFLTKLASENPVQIYGVNPAPRYHPNISYQGAFSPEDLEKRLLGSKFGLVWDGESLLTCAGISGNYMKFNNPHKTSLYLSLGIPVLIWDQSALAEFIVNEGVGITIDNLEKLDERLNKISNREYAEMKSKAIKISKKIKNGEFIRSAVEKVLENKQF